MNDDKNTSGWGAYHNSNEENKRLKEELNTMKHKYKVLSNKYNKFISGDIDEQIKLLQNKKQEKIKEQWKLFEGK